MSPNKISSGAGRGANSSVPVEQLIEFNKQLNDETQRQATFFKNFIKEFSYETPLRWWVYFAGLGGLVEGFRLIMDIIKAISTGNWHVL